MGTIGPLESGLPVRSCISCRKRANPSNLIRVVLFDGAVVPDIKGNAPGRGAWLHKSCGEVAMSRGVFRSAFKQDEAVDLSQLKVFLQSS